MCPHSSHHPWRHVARALSLGVVLSGLLLAACGGGGSDAPQAALRGMGRLQPPATATLAKDWPASEASSGDSVQGPATVVARQDEPGLLPEPADTVNIGPAGARVVRAAGALANGGHAVVWAAPLEGAQSPAWTLWVQAYDAQGHRSGEAAMLDIGPHVQAAQNASAVILPEGGVAVGYLASRQVDPTYPGTVETSAYTARFGLDGGFWSGPRLLDMLVSDHFYPRSNHLAGPVAMALGRDGSYLVGWRFVAGSYFGRQPAFRIQRLAADTEPLGWLQHLRRNDLRGDQQAFDRLRLTMLDEGGWAASFADADPELGVFGRVVQNDVARPLGIPHYSMMAPGAWLLDLRRHGSVLLAGRHGDTPGTPVAPYSMHFDRLGHEQDPVRPLPAIPTAAAALRGGDYVAIWKSDGAMLEARRYTPRGKPVGAAFNLQAAQDVEAAGLRGGGMALAWVETAGDASRVVTQRFVEPAAP